MFTRQDKIDGLAFKLNRREFLKGVGATVGGLALTSACTFSAFGENDLAEEQVIRVADISADAHGPNDPAWASWEYPYLHYMHNALLRFRPGYATPEYLEPDLAEEYDHTPDGKVWTFKLREGVQFQRGYGELTSEDVKFTFDRLRNDSAWTGFYDGIEEVEEVDRYTVKFRLKEVDALFKIRVSDYISGRVVSKKAYKDLGKEKFKIYPIGTGPWYIAEYTPKVHLIFKRHEDYFRGKPIIEKIEVPFIPSTAAQISAMITKEIDAIRTWSSTEVYETLKDAGFKFLMQPMNGWWLFLNREMSPTDDLKVRKALCYAINRSDLIDYFPPHLTYYKGGVIPDYHPDWDAKVPDYEYDPEKAKQLLAEAGYPEGFAFTRPGTSPEMDLYSAPRVMIQEAWRKVKAKTELKMVPYGSAYWEAIYSGNEPWGLYDAQRPSSLYFLQNFFHSDAKLTLPAGRKNFMLYDDPKTDALIEEALHELDDERRYKLSKEVQKRVAEDASFQLLYVMRYAAPIQPWVDINYEYENWLNYGFQLTEKSRILKH